MPANQQILKPRQEVDMEITVTDGDVMPYTYHLHDAFLLATADSSYRFAEDIMKVTA